MARPRTKNKHLPRYVTIIHGSYWYRPPKPADGSPRAKPTNLARVGDEATMYRKMADLMIPTEALEPTGKLQDYFDRYEREIVPTLAPRTQKDYHRHLKILRAEFGHRHPDNLQPKDIGRFLDVPKGKIQRARIVAVLSAIYSKMVGKWYVAEKNPCSHVERPKNPPRDRYVTDDEFNAIHAIMPARAKVAMELALLTGQRQGDILKLKWADVTDEGVAFIQGKTGQSRLILWSDALRDTMDRAKKLLPDLPREYVVKTRGGTRYSPEGFRAVWQRYMNKAMKKGVIATRFTFHDIRAKTVSDTEDVETAQLRAGHTNKAMTLRVYSRKMRKVTALK